MRSYPYTNWVRCRHRLGEFCLALLTRKCTPLRGSQEYPNSPGAGNPHSSADSANFLALIKQLRGSLGRLETFCFVVYRRLSHFRSLEDYILSSRSHALEWPQWDPANGCQSIRSPNDLCQRNVCNLFQISLIICVDYDLTGTMM